MGDIVPYPRARALEDADPRFVFMQKSQADFEPADVLWRPVEVVFFDAGHLVEYSVKAFERVLPSLSPTALVAVHDTGLHIADYGSDAPKKVSPFLLNDVKIFQVELGDVIALGIARTSLMN